jgi:hypothetical protein
MFLSDPHTKTDLFSQVCGKKFSVGGNSNHFTVIHAVSERKKSAAPVIRNTNRYQNRLTEKTNGIYPIIFHSENPAPNAGMRRKLL